MRPGRFPLLPLPLALLLVAGCTGAAGPAPTPSPSPTPAPVDLGVSVYPAEEPTAIRMAIPGSGYCFLVVVTDAGGTGGPVTITAEATKAAVQQILPAQLEPGAVGEVWVVADPTTVETAGTVTITATRGSISHAVARTLPVFPMADERAADAQPYFQRWVAWLAAKHPEVGITKDTEWKPVFVSTLLVVSHYSWWSPEWEMTVAWHNMIPPDDWTEVHLRKRFVDTAPTLAWRQDSVKAATEPHEVAPPAEVVR